MKRIESRQNYKKSNYDHYILLLVCFLLLIGLIFFPIHLRDALLEDSIGLYARLNFPFLLAICFLAYDKISHADFSRSDFLMTLLWSVSIGLILWSNYGLPYRTTIVAVCNLVLPLFILLFRFKEDQCQEFMKYFLIIFDGFIILLIICALIERFTDNVILSNINAIVNSGEYSQYLSYTNGGVWRFYSIWGHTLTNAVLFNAFFIVNDIYFKSMQKQYPKLVFFVISLAGVLLCSGKTAIAVLLIYMLISCWDNKRLLIGAAISIVVIMLGGGFNALFTRIQGTSLTTGRVGTFLDYLQSGENPLHFFRGYGTGYVYSQMAEYKAGFEFPILMDSLDYGILCALLIIVGMYVYVSYCILKQKKIIYWLGFSALFLQFNTYNGISLSNQDCTMWMCVFVMIIMNCALCDRKAAVTTVKSGDDSKREEK